MAITDRPSPAIAEELDALSRRFMTRLGKISKKEALAMFMDDETFSEEARLIAADSVESLYRGGMDGSLLFASGTALNLDIAARRVRLEQ